MKNGDIRQDLSFYKSQPVFTVKENVGSKTCYYDLLYLLQNKLLTKYERRRRSPWSVIPKGTFKTVEGLGHVDSSRGDLLNLETNFVIEEEVN